MSEPFILALDGLLAAHDRLTATLRQLIADTLDARQDRDQLRAALGRAEAVALEEDRRLSSSKDDPMISNYLGGMQVVLNALKSG